MHLLQFNSCNNNNKNIIINNSILLSFFCQTQNILQLGFHWFLPSFQHLLSSRMGSFKFPEFLNSRMNFLEFWNMIKNGCFSSSRTWSQVKFFELYNLIKIFFEFPEVDQEVFGVGVNLEILLKKIRVWILNVHLLSGKKKSLGYFLAIEFSLIAWFEILVF